MSEKKETPLLVLSNAPHVRTDDTVSKIMWMVVIALLPAVFYSVYIFGLNSLFIILASVIAAVASEALFQYLMKKPVSVSDGSAVITGLLVAMNVPPGSPLWVAPIGACFAVIIVKQLFGGIGFNIFNPALAARAFLVASWPVHMTTGWHKFAGTNVLSRDITNIAGLPEKLFDAVTQATPLTLMREAPSLLKGYDVGIDQLQKMIFSPEMIKSGFMGSIGGCIGETSAFLLLIGGLFLMYKKVITWHIPVSFIGTVGIFAYLYYFFSGYSAAPMIALAHVLSGGLFLGAFFMATDMVTSPVSAKGMIIFGVGCGIITFVIRVWGGYPEGVSYSILLMNAVVPLIDRFIKPRVFGKTKS